MPPRRGFSVDGHRHETPAAQTFSRVSNLFLRGRETFPQRVVRMRWASRTTYSRLELTTRVKIGYDKIRVYIDRAARGTHIADWLAIGLGPLWRATHGVGSLGLFAACAKHR